MIDNIISDYIKRLQMNFFLLDFGLSRVTSLQFIQYHVAGFYKLTIPQSPPSHLRDYSTCKNARLEVFHKFLFQAFDPNEWCLKNGLHSGGLNPRPLGHESSASTTRPRLLVSTQPILTISSFQMLVNIYCNEQMDFHDNVCCKGLPKATNLQLFLLNFLGLM